MKTETGSPDKSKEELKKTDISMSKLAENEGFFSALGKYADENFTKFSDGSHPIIGKNKFTEKYRDKPGPKTLTWEPVFADVSSSGDLGYTWGNWKFVQTDSVFYGNYITIWRKQKDGSWKMTLDAGNGTPPPQK